MNVKVKAGGKPPAFHLLTPIGFLWHNFRVLEREHADVAQLVAHNLAKVGVASSSLVIRSQVLPLNGGVAERRGSGQQSRLHGFESRLHLQATSLGDWRSGSALP